MKEDINERANMFAHIVESLDGKDVVDNIYRMIKTQMSG